MTAETVMAPVHPGEILLEEFLGPLGVSQYQLAKAVSVPARRINEIVHGQRRISADTALRLARYFGTSERFWINLQARYDLEVEKDRLGAAYIIDAALPADAPGTLFPQPVCDGPSAIQCVVAWRAIVDGQATLGAFAFAADTRVSVGAPFAPLPYTSVADAPAGERAAAGESLAVDL